MRRLAFDLLTYNVFLRPRYFLDGQRARLGPLAAMLNAAGHDALVLCELFDRRCRAELLALLAPHYPHRSSLLGATDRPLLLSGGVMVLSRWPIEAEEQRLFGDAACGLDRLGNKGVLYTRLRVAGRPLHLFATHAQSGNGAAAVRDQQMRVIHDLAQARALPAGEPVLFAGDFNVAADSTEYPAMLRSLDASAAEHRGHPYSYDPLTNDLATGRSRQRIDHLVFGRANLTPASATAEVLTPKCSAWRQLWPLPRHRDLSDHYPVLGRFTFH